MNHFTKMAPKDKRGSKKAVAKSARTTGKKKRTEKLRETKKEKATQPKKRLSDSKGEYFLNGFGQKVYYEDRARREEKAGKWNEKIRKLLLAGVTAVAPEIAVPATTGAEIVKEYNKEGESRTLEKVVENAFDNMIKKYLSS